MSAPSPLSAQYQTCGGRSDWMGLAMTERVAVLETRRRLHLSPDYFAPFRAGLLVHRDQPGLVVGPVDDLGRQNDLFRQRFVVEVAYRRARRHAADFEHVEIDRGEDRAGF